MKVTYIFYHLEKRYVISQSESSENNLKFKEGDIVSVSGDYYRVKRVDRVIVPEYNIINYAISVVEGYGNIDSVIIDRVKLY